MGKNKIKKIVYISLAAAIFFSVGGAFSFHANVAEAAKPTKWQTMLEEGGVDRALWQKYLPKITRSEYNKTKKKMSGSVNVQAQAKSKVTKWQLKLEAAGIPQSFWQKCLPKVKRKEYNRVKKQWAKSGGVATSSATVQPSTLGPEIAVGLWYFEKSEIKNDPFEIDANKDYNIRKKDGGDIIAAVSGGSTTRVTYERDGNLKIYSSISETIVDDKVWFDAVDGDNSSIIFDVHRPNDSYDHFRGKIGIKYYEGIDEYGGNRKNEVKQIWIINKLPLEYYVWGMGETTGTGPKNHVRVMTTIFRTYGKWYIDYATKYRNYDFNIRSDSGSQIYGGYDWEKDHPNIKEAAEATRGRIVKYKGETALTPYCSYTDGKTRKMGSDYPYLKSVKDHKKGTDKNLKPGDKGNHMWGLSAHGALGYAEDGKSWEWILKHYYTKVDIDSAY